MFWQRLGCYGQKNRVNYWNNPPLQHLIIKTSRKGCRESYAKQIKNSTRIIFLYCQKIIESANFYTNKLKSLSFFHAFCPLLNNTYLKKKKKRSLRLAALLVEKVSRDLYLNFSKCSLNSRIYYEGRHNNRQCTQQNPWKMWGTFPLYGHQCRQA